MRSFLTPLEVEAAEKVVAGVIQLFRWMPRKDSGDLILDEMSEFLYISNRGMLE
ncbi:hypothetical protein V441_07905 [Pseudomonas aeruginosa DHS29]|nr:hypothetical protein PA13_1006705 [Pseudomonas aeruginosa HB13]ESZ83865.1 hypothetical protein V441_07905 [Pseudomonas aeruginosa DHS29]